MNIKVTLNVPIFGLFTYLDLNIKNVNLHKVNKN
jgi:hypothetical protein